VSYTEAVSDRFAFHNGDSPRRPETMTDTEEENLTILSSWASAAYRCFAAEFDELEQLKQKHASIDSRAQHELEMRCRAEVDLQIQREYPDVYPLLSEVSSSCIAVAAPTTAPPVQGGSAGGSAVKRQKSKQAQQQLQAEIAMVTAKREALLQQHIQAALAAQDRQPARQLASRYAHQLDTTQKHVKAHLEREVHELQRFTSRPLASYALGEVLKEPPVTAKASPAAKVLTSPPSSPSKRSAAASLVNRGAPAGAASASRAASERGSNHSARTKKSAGRSTVRGGRGIGGARTRSYTHGTGGRKPEVVVESSEKREQGTSSSSAADGAADLRPPPFLIDAHQFAVEYNEMLKKEYGYRPAMTNSFPSAADNNNNIDRADGGGDVAPEAADTPAAESVTHAARTKDTALSLQEKLRTHIPGHTTKHDITSSGYTAAGGGDNYDLTGWLPPIRTASLQRRFTASGSPLSSSQHAPAAITGDGVNEGGTQRLTHSSPTLRQHEKAANTTRSKSNNRTQQAATGSSSNAAPAKPTSTKTNTRVGAAASTASSNPLNGVYCAAKEKGLEFSTYVGVPTRQTVRFVNRNAYRTRLRLKAPAHPWLTYRCVRIAPAAGTSATSSSSANAVPAETPLNCGGFVEVEVTFDPTSIDAATAAVDAALEMGVARELNDRLGGGAQWQFMHIPVHAQVALPHFDWWRQRNDMGTERGRVSGGSDTAADVLVLSDEGVQSTESVVLWEPGELVSHKALVSCATPLNLSDGAAVEFGDVLVLGRVEQTLLLENTGSEAVINVLSSSPEFALSLTPEVATAVPPSHALALRVVFCPLKEGFCEATVTVTVRASSESGSAVLSEHTVELHGSGVVPRVCVASLASQTVQTGVLPQWQVRESEAPLYTVLKDTMPGVPARVAVTVRNECAAPLAFHWEGDNDAPRSDEAGSGREEGEGEGEADEVPSPDPSTMTTTRAVATLVAESFISPSSGVLPPFSTETFTLTVTPATLQPLQTLYNLFLDDVPDPAAAENAEKLPFVDAEVLQFYQRNRPIPCTVPQHQGDIPSPSPSSSGAAGHDAGPLSAPGCDLLHVTYLDPITAFTRLQRCAAGETNHETEKPPFNGVFAASFLTYQQPSLPSLTIAPVVVEERVECLLKCRHTRTVTLHNNAPVALHFVLDPTEAEFTSSLRQLSLLSSSAGPGGCGAAPLLAPTASTFERWRGFFPASDGIAVQCHPRKGVVPAYGTVSVAVHFTVEACGPHYAVVPCWVPEVEQLRALLATVGPASRTAPTSRRPSLTTRPTSSRGWNPQPSQPPPPQLSVAGAAGPSPPSRRRSISPSALQLTPDGTSPGNRCLSERRLLTTSVPVSVANAVTTLSHSPLEEALRIIEEGGCYAINVTATGVGATVKASTELLDFGLIELGQEAAASFTVSNPNSVPVVFDLSDPLMRHPPRFVFIPESFRLGAGNTVEVTVYRKAVSTEDAQTFFELSVRDGGAAVAVETRATIQQSLLVVDSPVVQLGVVPEGVWQTGTFTVSNRSAIDTEFTMMPATPLPPCMEMEYETSFVLLAGEQLEVPVRCRFQAVYPTSPTPTASVGRAKGSKAGAEATLSAKQRQASGDGGYSTLLGLVSRRSRQTLLVEVRCEAVEKLSVSVDVVPDTVHDGAELPMPIAAYIRAVLMNTLEAALLAHEQNQAETTHADTSAMAGGPSTTSAITTTLKKADAEPVMIPYCSPARLVDYMPDDLPLSRRSVTLLLQSYTGGDAMFTVAAQRYAPQPMESIGAQRILEEKNRASLKTAAKADETAKRKGGADEEKDSTSRAALMNAAATDEAAITLPAFWTAAMNGGATVHQAQRQIVEAAQKVLGDGSGCATLLSSVAGILRSHGTVRIPVELWCALPGRYLEHLCVRADPTLPLLHIPVEFEVYGKPIVLDATTSGLTKGGGREGEDVLLMPPVIAPLGSSRRTIRLINRVSRDIDVTVEVFPCPLGMIVHADDPDVPADEVELKLLTMTAEDKEREVSRVGRVTATPLKLCIPAHARREVVLEFTPSAGLSDADVNDDRCLARAEQRAVCKDEKTTTAERGENGDEDDSEGDEEAMLPPTEKWWQGSVCINAVLAQSEANDTFLVDEFYTIHADRYPSQRVARPLTGSQPRSEHANSGSSTSFSMTGVKVSRPLRTRPNDRVVRRGRIVWPTEAEQRVLDWYAANQAAATAAGAAAPLLGDDGDATSSKRRQATASSDDDDDDDGAVIDATSFAKASRAHNGNSNTATGVVPPLEVLLREAEERQALLDFISARRAALQVEGNRYFSSIELRLRARCGRPHLTIEPSEKGVEFPAVPRADHASPAASALRCSRTVRLTNRNSAPLRFALSFIPSTREGGSVASPDHLFSIVRCALWQSGHDEAKELFASAMAAAPEASDHGNTTDASSSAHVYTLDSMDALDVTVDAHPHHSMWSQQLSPQHSFHGAGPLQETLEGMLKVQFLPASAVTVTAEVQNTPEQLLPLRIPLAVPSVECKPGMIWFRPGQLRHDGRPQVAYTQTFTLYNASATPAHFHIYPVAPDAADAFHQTAMNSFRAQQQQRGSLTMAPTSAATTNGLVTASTMTTTVGVAGAEALIHSHTQKVKAVVSMPATAPPAEGRAGLVYVDDPSQFTISPLAGTLPPASLGGEPGEMEIQVDFREFSSIRYESLFAIVLDGDPSVPPTYVMVRGDSRSTEL
jgi:hypothetical protein